MLTNKGKYGLKAMVHLAGLEPGSLAQAADIAEANTISKKFLDHILADLCRAGLVYSRKGKGGGYGLARPTADIRVGAIVRALDGPLAPIGCASVTAFRPCGDCADLTTCPVRLIMIEARNAIADLLDNRSLAEMRSWPARPLQRRRALSKAGRFPSQTTHGRQISRARLRPRALMPKH